MTTANIKIDKSKLEQQISFKHCEVRMNCEKEIKRRKAKSKQGFTKKKLLQINEQRVENEMN